MSQNGRDNLPEGWTLVKATDVCQVNPRKPAADALPDDAPVTFAPMAAVDEDLGAITNPDDRPFGEVRPKSYTPFAEGDVLFAKITPCMENGKAAVARGLSNGLGFGTTEFHVLRSTGAVVPEYLYHYIRQQSFRDDARAHMAGAVGQLRVPADYVKHVEFPLPPLAEQERIVEKVEALLARVRSVRQRLATVPDILKHFRQAVLAHACSGRLTEDWRGTDVDDHDDGLPRGWSRPSLSELCTAFQYGSSQKSDDTGDVPVLRMGNLQDGRIDWSNLKFSSDAAEIDKYALEPNTVLFNRTNSPELVGKTAIYRGERPAIFAGYLIRIVHGPELDPEYLNYCLNEQAFREYCMRVKSDGVSQSNINAKKLAAYEMPHPPLAEQQEIVRRVNDLFARADSIEHRVAEATRRADALTQSILARAFRGELVPTEADLAATEGREYETAEQLLTRIRNTSTESIKGRSRRRCREVTA